MLDDPSLDGAALEGDNIHVYPFFGREHVLEGVSCWCRPTRDDEEPTVVIHNPDH